jgi:NCS1 family nucleobase:cation symporter-1
MAEGSLTNADLAPTGPEQRTWSTRHIAALWVGMAVCIPTYGLASGLVANGYSLGLAVASIAIGNLIILVPLLLNAHPGTQYGIPFPVLLRAPFGVLGSNVPALMRALVACGWFGVNTWIGGSAIYTLAMALLPDSWSLPNVFPDWFGINSGQFLAFTAFWLLNVVVIARGIQTIRVLETWAAPLLIGVGVALLGWAWSRAGSLSAMLDTHRAATAGGVGALGVGITSAVAFWGTLALNIPDFSRFARSQRDQAVGQAIGLPATMVAFAFIGAVVTNVSGIADPVVLTAQIGGPALTVVAMAALAIATLTTNLAANVVSPANDFANLAPSKIDFKKGALIAAVVGFVIMPWKLWQDAQAYIATWLLGYGAMLGAVGGVMIADYYILRRRMLLVDDLYRRGGAYEYKGGFNPVALVALAVGIAPNVPGFLGALGAVEPPDLFVRIYQWAWFVSFFLAGAVYLAGMKISRGRN